MGLYWKLLPPARAGQERELEAVRQRAKLLRAARRDASDAAELARLAGELDVLETHRRALAQDDDAAMRAAAAPRLGIDPRAEAWLRDQREAFVEAGTWSGTPPWDAFVADYVRRGAGAYVIEASNPLALPIPAAPVELTGPYGLDVSYLVHVGGFDDALVGEAFDDHDDAAMRDYESRLLASLAALATDPDPDPDTKLFVGLVLATANWLAFWAGHGFAFAPIVDDS